MPTAEIMRAGKFLDLSLKRYESQLDETIYPELWGYEGQYHNAVADLQFGVKEYAHGRIDHTGRAVNYGGKATTLPLANFGIEMDKYKTAVGVLAADWSWTELKAQEASANNPYMPQLNIIQEYNAALDKGLREWMHIKTIFGDASLGMTGLLNNPYVEVVEVLAADFMDLTSATDIYDYMRGELSDFRKASKLTATATNALTSEDVMLKLGTRYNDGSSDGTPIGTLTGRGGAGIQVLQTFNVANEMSITSELISDYGLTGLTAGEEWMLLYESSTDNMIKHYKDIEMSEPFMLDDGLTYRRIGMCAVSEVIYKRPYRARLYKFATA